MKNEAITRTELNKRKSELLDQIIPKYEFGVFKEDLKACKNPNKETLQT